MQADITDVAIIGAGPYGLSLAAHLTASGVNFRIFGKPLEIWRDHMPKGMKLKSDGFASNLYDPGEICTLSHYCAQHGIPYDDMLSAVDLETFVRYGLHFQEKMVPQLEQVFITKLSRGPAGFELELQTGEKVTARKVVVATGVSYYDFLPEIVRHLPKSLVTHSGEHSDLSVFRGREVVVIGGGSSAADAAALLHQNGAKARLIARREVLRFLDHNDRPRSIWEKLKAPDSGLGSGWRSRLCTDLPLVFHSMPKRLRLRAVKRHLGPAPGWAVKRQLVGNVTLTLGAAIHKVEEKDGRVQIEITRNDGTSETVTADHLICGTGYRVSLAKLPFLDEKLRQQIAQLHETPILNRNFRSSVPGLYFVGLMAANSFGPLLRFAYGAGFTSRRLCSHLAKLRNKV